MQSVVDVVTAEQVAQTRQALAPHREVAVDIEADMHHFHARLCFVQLGTPETVFLLDTLAPGVAPAELGGFWADPEVTKYFHAAGGDLAYLAEAEVRVRGLFDTHRAATLLGWPKVGLADLALQHLGVTLKKEHQQADFSQRPLPPDLRAYIADDVRYLIDVGRMVREACRAADIEEEVALDCQRLGDDAAHRPDLSRGVPKLPKQGLTPDAKALGEAIARELHLRRLQWAEAADVPMGRMLSNKAVGDIASRPPDTLRDLARREGVRGPFVRQHGDAVLALLKELKAQQAGGTLPKPAAEVPVDRVVRKREEALLEWRKEQSTARKVTPSVVLSNGLVTDLARLAPPDVEALAKVPYLGTRRLERDGAKLLELLR